MLRHPSQTSSSQASGLQRGPSASQKWCLPLLLIILGLALGLRLWGIGFGLPYEITYRQVTFEEAKEVHRAFKLGAGEYAWSFGKGGLYYLLFVEYAFYYIISWLMGWVSNAREFALQVVQNRTPVFLMGRVTVALMGTLTCYVMFALGKRAYDWRVGLGAAFIGATAYFHAVFSHFINVDIGMALALWASLLAYLVYEEKGRLRWLISAGALGGIAIAFKLTGAVVLPLLLVAVATAPSAWQHPRQRIKEAGILVLALFITLTIVAPEWTTSLDSLHKNFSRSLDIESAEPPEEDVHDTIRELTVLRGKDWTGYLQRLFNSDYNVALTLSALLGTGLGLWRRNRWDMIWSAYIIVFLVVMSSADRNQPERYLLPIMPALWLLSSRAIDALSRRQWSLGAVGLTCVVAIPLATLVQSNYEMTKPDTRLLAKAWIETNVPSGAKILMDGMRHRFIPSPPLNPDSATLTRQVTEASQERERLGRGGVSERTLALYAKARERAAGPKYELHTTMYGLAAEDLTFYIQDCFDYIITSSYITQRFSPGRRHRERHPEAARFYDQLRTDPRFRVAYHASPMPWQSSGPTITVYEVLPRCESVPKGDANLHVQ